MEDTIKQGGPEKTGSNKKKNKGRGSIISRRGRAFLVMLVAVLVLSAAYAMATGHDIPAVVGSIVSVLLHAVLGA